MHSHKHPTGFGHITIAYLASNFVEPQTAHYFQTLLRNDTGDYLANVATWADSIRYSKWGHYTGVYHFIDAKDSPPDSCNVDLARDCKAEGCVVTAIQNYTTQVLDPHLPVWLRAQAVKFVVHFVGDIHQPLHDEDIARGGNGIHVLWEGSELNLHHVWDSSIAERWVGGRVGRGRKPYVRALEWAGELAGKIEDGVFAAEREKWLEGMDFEDMVGTALGWATEGNAYVCSHGKTLLLIILLTGLNWHVKAHPGRTSSCAHLGLLYPQSTSSGSDVVSVCHASHAYLNYAYPFKVRRGACLR